MRKNLSAKRTFFSTNQIPGSAVVPARKGSAVGDNRALYSAVVTGWSSTEELNGETFGSFAFYSYLCTVIVKYYGTILQHRRAADA